MGSNLAIRPDYFCNFTVDLSPIYKCCTFFFANGNFLFEQ